MQTANAHKEPLPMTCVRWKPLGTMESQKTQTVLVTTSADGYIQHWHVNTGKAINTMKEEVDNDLYALDFTSDGKLMATAGSNTIVYVYDEQTRQKVLEMKVGGKKLPGHSSRIFAVRFSPQDPNVLVSGGWDRTLQIYDIREGRTVA